MSSVMSIEGSFTYGVLWNVLLWVLRNVPRAWCTTKFLTECSLKVHGLKDVLWNVLPGFLRGILRNVLQGFGISFDESYGMSF